MTNRSGLARTSAVLGLMLAVHSGAALGQALECEGPAPAGCFEATVSADDGTAQMSGFATAFGSTDAKGAGWAVQFIVPGGASGMMLIMRGEKLPPPGEFPIDDFMANDADPPEGSFIASGNADLQGSGVKGFQSVEGTVVITASSSSWVQGSFQYQGRDPESGATVAVEGRFKAKQQGL